MNPIEIAVDIQSIEEYWATQYIILFVDLMTSCSAIPFRLINMLGCLDQLTKLEFCVSKYTEGFFFTHFNAYCSARCPCSVSCKINPSLESLYVQVRSFR